MKSIKINNVTILAGDDNISITPTQPYDSLVCDFLADLSKNILANKDNNNYSDVISLGFWCRRANIKLLQEKYDTKYIRIGLGYIFHITPSNVPINFAFSFFFGLLSGNSNIVRIPSKQYIQTQIICSEIDKLFKQNRYHSLASKNAIISYPKNDSITSYFSQQAQGRVIWGGDSTIKQIKSLPSLPACVDLAFRDRTSLSIINEKAIETLNDKDLETLIENFYNDTYFMDQNACSSPFLIIWMDTSTNNIGKKRFWETLNKKVHTHYDLELISSVDKYTLLCEQAINLETKMNLKEYSTALYVIALENTQQSLENYRGKFGHFFEIDIHNLNSIANLINEKYQTLTYFGMNTQELSHFVLDNSLLGIDRIVPIGQALSIGTIWDGYDTIQTLSRIIEIK